MANVLIVDDEQSIRRTLGSFLERDGHTVAAVEDVAQAKRLLDEKKWDVVVTDIIMPGAEGGVDLLRYLHRDEVGPSLIMVTGEPSVDTAAAAVRYGAYEYLSKPVSRSEICRIVTEAAKHKKARDCDAEARNENQLLKQRLGDLSAAHDGSGTPGTADQRATIGHLRRALGGITEAMARTVEMKDPYTAGHQRRVTDLSRAIASALDLDRETKEGLRVAAAIHDIGKIAIPSEILSRPRRLTKSELSLVRDHVQIGYDLLKQIDFPWPIATIILQHHERLDGSGYPAGLTGDAIRPEARILNVADTVEAMSSPRPHRPALGEDSALQEILEHRGVTFDPDVVDACVHLFREEGFRFKP